MILDVSEGIDPSRWAALPTDDRVLVGGRTVWTGPFRDPLVVCQPNRWGIIEASFPDVPCVIEVDPPVSGHLALPDRIVGFVDRSHAPIPPPAPDPLGTHLISGAQTLSKAVTQIRGITLAATPFARTIPLMTPRESHDVIAGCGDRGMEGVRPLPGLAGGVAITVTKRLAAADFETIVRVLKAVVASGR